MKICVLTHTFPKYKNDSTAAFMHPLVLGLIAAGNDVTVLTPYHEALKPDDFPYRILMYKYIRPIRFHLLGYSQTLQNGSRLTPIVYLLAPFLYLSGLVHLFFLQRKEHFDCISAHWILPNGFIAACVSWALTVPYAISLPGSDVYIANKNGLFRWMARFACAGTKCISADSPIYIQELRRTGATIHTYQIIPYPVDTDAVRAISKKNVTATRRSYGISKTTAVLLCVGRLVYKKGFHVLLQALPSVIRTYPHTVLLIAGDGDLNGQLKTVTHEEDIDTNVRFLGAVSRDKIRSLYAIADVFVMPSIADEEGNIDDRPVALIEAMACERAVIATNFPGNSLTISHNRNGILVPQKDSQSLTRAILRLLASDSLRRSLGGQARRTVIEKFNYRAIGRQYHRLCTRLIKTYG